MNINNINHENRNAMGFIPTNLINNLRRRRCCSFCRQPGHNVTFCNDVRINDFELDCKVSKLLFESTEEPINMFSQWLSGEYLRSPLLVRSFAIRKCNCTLRSTFQQCIDSIKNYIFNEYNEEETDDFIPFTTDDEMNAFTDNIILEPAEILMLFNYRNDLEVILNINSEIIKYNFITTVKEFNKKEQDEKCDCSICLENLEKEKFVKLGCNHEFCGDCLIGTIKATKSNNPRCAFCREDITYIATYSSEINSKFDKFKI
jgi:hypothetical protein